MNRITLYTEGNDALHRLHPFAKLAYCLTTVLAPLIAGRPLAFVCTLSVSLILLFAAHSLRKVLPVLAFSLTILVTIFLIHGLFHHGNQTVLFRVFGLTFYQEGVRFAMSVCLNLLNMLLSFSVFVLLTRPSDLVDALEQAGFSPKFGYMILSVFQIIPQMSASFHTILDAQKSRGLKTEGSLLLRAKAFLPLISPVVSSALINTRERAIALEVRGFSAHAKKTFLKDTKLRSADKTVMLLCALALAFSIAYRIRNVLLSF